MGPGHEERRTRKCSCKRCGFPGLSLCVCRTVRTAIAKPLLNLPVKRPSTLTKTTFYSLLLPPVGTPYEALPLARSLSLSSNYFHRLHEPFQSAEAQRNHFSPTISALERRKRASGLCAARQCTSYPASYHTARSLRLYERLCYSETRQCRPV